jgi:hypothetical protein
MASIKVSALTAKTTPAGTEELLINDSGVSKKITIDNVTENNFTDTLKSKLDAIEASADVTDTTNVTSAGALMDSEVTNLAAVKAFATTDYATAAQGTTADAALPKAGGAMTGAITTNSTFDGRDVATDGTKLDGIETGATADQTQSDINALGITATGVDLGNWTLTESAGVLYFASSGTNKAKLDASGNFTVTGDVISNGTV